MFSLESGYDIMRRTSMVESLALVSVLQGYRLLALHARNTELDSQLRWQQDV